MKASKYFQAVVLSAIVMWLVAGIAHEILFAKFYATDSHETHKGPAIIFVAYLILSMMMTYCYAILPKRGNYLVDGIKFGAFIGVLWVFPHGLAIAAAHGESLGHEVLNGLWHIFEQSIGGVIIARIIQNQIKRTAAA